MGGASSEVDVVVHRAALEIERGRADLARATVEEALRREPTNAIARGVLAHALAELGELDRADAMLEPLARVPELAELSIRLRAQIARARAAAVTGRGRAARLERAAHAERAVRLSQESVALAPTAWEARAGLAASLREAGVIDGAVAESREAVRLASADPPDFARALLSLAASAVLVPSLRGEALAAARTAVSIEPANEGFLQALAAVEHTAGRRTESISTALRALRLAPVERVPAVLARYALFSLLHRTLLVGLVVAFAVPMIAFAGILQATLPALGEELGGPLAARIGGALGLALFLGAQALVLRPLLADAEVRRAVLRFGRRRFTFWLAVVPLALTIASYALATVIGLLPFVPGPLLLLLLAYVIHGWSAFALPRL